MKSKLPLFLVLLLMPFILTGCLGEMMELACIFIPDPAHCYQGAATQQADPYGCEKVEQPEQFKSAGSNPPRDKCYLMIAQNTGDYSVCKNIKGGMYSYTKEECISSIATDKIDPAGCKHLTGAAAQSCRAAVGEKVTTDKLTGLDQDISDLQSTVGKDPDDADARKRLKDLEQQRKDLLEVAPPGTTNAYTKARVGEIMGDVEDEDVASSIRKDYIDYKKQNPTATIDQLMTRLQTIKKEQETIKRLDDEANELVDTLKGHITDYTDEKKEELVGAVTDQGWKWMKENGGDRLKWQMDKLEEMKGKYDKASERYTELQGKFEKIKKVYDEVSGVYKKVDEFNKQIARGEITQGQAKVLKGAVLLGKGLEYATQYVPVFGSTVSTISKETFDATIQLANKRAKRTTAINNCIEDPEHCNPDGITAY